MAGREGPDRQAGRPGCGAAHAPVQPAARVARSRRGRGPVPVLGGRDRPLDGEAPAETREAADRILLQAAAAGASLEDLATIAAAAIEQWRSAQPDPGEDFDFRDRHLKLGLTFGGAGVIRGDLTPECAAAVTAVLEALGKRRGPEDDRNEGQRLHDALAEACHLLLRARLVPAGPAPTPR